MKFGFNRNDFIKSLKWRMLPRDRRILYYLWDTLCNENVEKDAKIIHLRNELCNAVSKGKMTEKEAWKWIGNKWKNETIYNFKGWVGVYIVEYHWIGLCSCITELLRYEKIEEATAENMLKKIRKVKPQPGAPENFKWDWSKEAAELRAQYCEEQSNKYT